MCEDFDECLFAGPQEMIEQFMAPDGLRISNLDQLIIKSEFWSMTRTKKFRYVIGSFFLHRTYSEEGSSTEAPHADGEGARQVLPLPP